MLKGCIVTIDAMGCQTKIAKLIVDEEADYVLALKGNQGTLHNEVQDLFTYARETNFRDIAHDFDQTIDNGHGRIEVRRHWIISEPELIAHLDPDHKWAGLRSIGMVESKRQVGDKSTTEIRYYIATLPGEANEFGKAVRTHWEIENRVHWVLDVAFPRRRLSCAKRVCRREFRMVSQPSVVLWA